MNSTRTSSGASRWSGSSTDVSRAGGRWRLVGAWCAGVLLAGVSVVVGCRVADTDAVTPVPQVLAFLPWLLGPAGVGVVLSLLARWWAG